MHNVRLAAVLALTAAISCKPVGALTPRQAFYDVKTAFETEDTLTLTKTLSQGSINKLNDICKKFAAMKPEQRIAAGELYGIDPNALASLTAEDALDITLASMRADILGKGGSIAGVEQKDEEGVARVVTEAGCEFNFVKEGSYWKWDISGI